MEEEGWVEETSQVQEFTMDFDTSEQDEPKMTTRDNVDVQRPHLKKEISRLKKLIKSAEYCLKCKSGRKSILIQKAIAVCSMYQYYDMFDKILRDFYERFSYDPNKKSIQTSLME